MRKKIRKKVRLRDKRVVVMGIGLHGGGVSMIKWLARQGAKVVATDKKTKEALASSLKKLGKLVESKKVKLIVGRHRIDDFRSADLVIKNPSVPWKNVYIQQAQKRGIPVEMDSSLFFKLSPSKKIIGVTGTKGKTTTSHIIKHILEKAGKKVVLVGVGTLTVMDRLKLIDKNTHVVFELSSWRLSVLRRKKKSPRYAVVTNIFPDHLNYYRTMKDYIKDKLAIVQFQKKNDLAVLNYDDEVVREFSEETKAEISFFSVKNSYSIIPDVFLEDEMIKYRGEKEDGIICSVKDLKILGRHNIYNVMAGVALALKLKISPKIIAKAVKSFKGVKHRLELVIQREDVLFYNDSAATTPEAAVAGINAFLNRAELFDIYLIAGGSSKKLDPDILVEKILQTPEIKKVVLLKGGATEGILKSVKKRGGSEKFLKVVDSMNEAVRLLTEQIVMDQEEEKKAAELTNESAELQFDRKKVLLLSPGAASFGMFDNEFDRGRQFREAVKKYAGKLSGKRSR